MRDAFQGLRRRMALVAFLCVLVVSGCGGSSGSQAASASTPKPSLPPISPTPAAEMPGLFVDATSDLGSISPFVYGSNFGPWLAVTPDQRPFVDQAKLKFLTWPGGNWGDENDITEPQIDSFIAMCRQLGAEPRIVVRLKDSTPEKAAEIVKYVNVTKGYGVKYWGIGNEADLYKDYDVNTYTQQWRTWADAMRKVDASIKLVGPDVSQYTGSPDDQYATWLKAFLKADGDLVDVVSIHRYPFGGDNEPTTEKLRDNSQEWDKTIPALRQLIRDQTGRDIPVAVTELNSSWSTNAGGDATLDSHDNAIWFGDVLGRLIRQDVFMVAQFALTGQYAIVDKYDPWPIWNVYVMYQQFGTQLLRATSDDPLVSAYGAKRSDGSVTVILINLGPDAATKPLQVGGLTAPSAETWQFDKDHKAGQIAATPIGGSITLPAESMTLLVIARP